MSNHLGEFVQSRRETQGLTRYEVARRLGYKNLTKGSRRLTDLEEGRQVHKDFLVRLMSLFEIEPLVVQELIERDRQDFIVAWNKWADEPIPISVTIRLIPGFFGGTNLPEAVKTEEQAIAFGVETATRMKKKVFVVISRRKSRSTIHEDGRVDGPIRWSTPEHSATPYMSLGKSKFLPSHIGHERQENGHAPSRDRSKAGQALWCPPSE